jgi:hypothetical protein
MPYRIEVLAHNEDGRGLQIQKALQTMGKKTTVRVVDVYTSANPKAKSPEFIGSLANPVVQKAGIAPPTTLDVGSFDWAVEIGFLPGVTDNIGHTASELLTEALGAASAGAIPRKPLLIDGNVTEERR